MEITKGKNFKCIVTGIAAGLVNGFFGGGGGMILIPLLTRWIKLEEKQSFATSVAIILPICIVSVVVYLLHTEFELKQAIPFITGGFAGGFLGGICLKRLPVSIIRTVFAIIMIWGGVRIFI